MNHTTTHHYSDLNESECETVLINIFYLLYPNLVKQEQIPSLIEQLLKKSPIDPNFGLEYSFQQDEKDSWYYHNISHNHDLIEIGFDEPFFWVDLVSSEKRP